MDGKSTWTPYIQTWKEKCCMICWNSCQTHLQEVGMTQILTDHVIVKGFRHMVRLLDERALTNTCSCVKWPWGPLHTRAREPVTITLQALSLVEEVQLLQVRYFTLCLRDQWSMWSHDGCKVYMGSYMASNGSCFMVTWDYFQNPPFGGRPNTQTTGRPCTTLRMLPTVDLFYIIMHEDPHE